MYRILDIGCGVGKYKSNKSNVRVIGLDRIFLPDVDVVYDLEKLPLPFKDNRFDEIRAHHVLEHVINFVPLVHELWRITKPNGIIKVWVPFYSSYHGFSHPTHVRFFTPFTFDFFCEGTYEVCPNGKKLFNLKRRYVIFSKGKIISKLNPIINPLINMNQEFYCRFFAWTLPASEIYFELQVVKDE